MDRILIEGGVPLHGELAISGSKNAVLPLMVAALLSDEKLVLRGTPRFGRYAHAGASAGRSGRDSGRVWQWPRRGCERAGSQTDFNPRALWAGLQNARQFLGYRAFIGARRTGAKSHCRAAARLAHDRSIYI